MIEPLDRSSHTPKCLVRCDDCGLTQQETCDYERTSAGAWKPNEGQVLHRLTKAGWTYAKRTLRCMACELKRKSKARGTDMTRSKRGLTETEERFLSFADGTRTHQELAMAMGWSSDGSIRNYLVKLASHGAKAKPSGGTVVQMTPPKPTSDDLRKPTAEQKRQIFEMLGVVYDTKAGRFTDCESDVTVAAALGNGIMFGWVAAIREEFFGPDGGNEELEKLRADMRAWQDMAQELRKTVEDALPKIVAGQTAVAEMQRRMDALVKAAGPRGRLA